MAFNNRSWKPALAAVGAIKVLGYTKQERERVRNYPVFENSREDMFQVLRYAFASVQLEAGVNRTGIAPGSRRLPPRPPVEKRRPGLAARDHWSRSCRPTTSGAAVAGFGGPLPAYCFFAHAMCLPESETGGHRESTRSARGP